MVINGPLHLKCNFEFSWVFRVPPMFISILMCNIGVFWPFCTELKRVPNKKVLLHECKRHTDCCLSSTPCAVLSQGGTPHPDLAQWGSLGTACPDLAWGDPGYPPSWPGLWGTPGTPSWGIPHPDLAWGGPWVPPGWGIPPSWPA